MCKNSSGLVYYEYNKNLYLLILRDRITKEWMVPGGEIDKIDYKNGDPSWTAFKREFKEEVGTNFPCDYLRKKEEKFNRGNPVHTKIYVEKISPKDSLYIRNQYDPKKIKNYETDKLEYINIKHIINGEYNNKIKIFKGYVMRTIKEAIKKKYFKF